MTARKLIEELSKLERETEVYVIYPYDQSYAPVVSVDQCPSLDGVFLNWYEKPKLVTDWKL